MKYISKLQSLSLTLRSGIPANKALGTQPVPGLYFRFERSLGDTASIARIGSSLGIDEEELIKMIENHSAFNVDFFRAEDAPVEAKLPVNNVGDRRSMETIVHGSIKRENPQENKITFSPEQKAFIKELFDGYKESVRQEIINDSKPTEDVKEPEPSNEDTEDYEFSEPEVKPEKEENKTVVSKKTTKKTVKRKK